MDDRPTIPLTLASGEVRQILLTAGSAILVISGQLAWRDAPQWLAESLVANTCLLGPEEVQRANRSGWVELSARSKVQAVIIRPTSVAPWLRLRLWLERLFARRARAEG
ncbi:hypothetical protein [Accumulibacter sp.]|uniref:hypothetical protein n=1 Tax=Accumulibacter sp. TaxID=2053492 RepID=UPI0026194880|nr:hypothetical protein [Accumulibacter sp.]